MRRVVGLLGTLWVGTAAAWACSSGYTAADAPDAAADGPEDDASDSAAAACALTPGSGPAPASGERTCGSVSVDVGSNPQNCGACGRDCRNTTCTGGLCAPEVLASVTAQGFYLGAPDPDGHFYVAFNEPIACGTCVNGILGRLPIDGGAIQTLLTTGQADLQTIATDDTRVYSWQGFSRLIYAVDKTADASTDAQTVGSVAAVTGMVGTPSALYVGTDAGLQRLQPKTGGTPMSVFQEEGILGGMITDGVALYWSSQSDAGAHTTRFGLEPFGALAHSANVAAASWMAVDDAYVYDFDANAGAVRRMNKASLDPPETLATIQDKTFVFAAGAAVDEANVYLALTRTTASPRDVTLVRVPKCGGDPVVLAAYAGSYGPGIFVDATYVYYSDALPGGGPSRVLRVAK